MRALLFSILVSALALSGSAQAVVPRVLAVDPVHGRVLGPGGAFYDVRDLSLVATAQIGALGQSLVSPVDTGRHRLFLAELATGHVVVVDTNDFSTQTIDTGVPVSNLLLDPISHRLWLLSSSTNSVVAIADDLGVQSRGVAGLDFLSPRVDAHNDRLVLMTNPASTSLAAIAGADLSLASIAIGEIPSRFFAIDPARDRIYVGLPGTNVGVDPHVDARIGVVEGDALAQEIAVPGTEPFFPSGFPPDVRLANPAGDEIWTGSGINFASAARLRVATQTLSPNWGAFPEFFDVVANKFTHDYNENSAEDSIVDIETRQGTILGSTITTAIDVLRSRSFGVNVNTGDARALDHARTATTTIATGFGPGYVAVDPVTNRIFVANRASDTVTVIDGATRATQTIPVGDEPAAVAVNPATGRVYVANHLGDSVTVIDGATLATSTIPAGDGPIAIAVNEAANRIYVANHDSDTVTVIEGGNGSTRTVNVGNEPSAVAVDPVAGRAYVANTGNASVTILMGSDLFAFTRPTGAGPSAIAVDATRKRAYTVNSAGDSVTLIRGDLTVQNFWVGHVPSAIAIDSVSGRFFVANRDYDSVYAIMPENFSTTAVFVGDAPGAIAVDPGTHFIYVANRLSNDLTRIDPVTLATKTFATGTSPLAVAVNPVTHTAYVSNYLSTNVTELADFIAAPLPVTTTITADPPAANGAVSLALTATNGFPALPVQNVFVQLDDQMGPWEASALSGDAGSFTTPPLAPGLHVARAWSSVGLESDATIPIPGSVAALPLVVPAREGALSFDLSSTATSATRGNYFPLSLAIENGRSTLQGFALFLLLVGPGGSPRYTLANGLQLSFPSSMEFAPTFNLLLPGDAAAGTWTIGGAIAQSGVGLVDQDLLTFSVP